MSIAVLVTGGAGYIGSHVAKALAAAGYTPVTYDNLVHGDPEFVRWGPLVEGDIADRDLVAATLRRYRIEAVMHFAALIEVSHSMKDALAFFDTNVGGSISLLRAAAEANVKSVVFSSSCAVYGPPHVLPIPEDHPCAPANAYGASKLMVEGALHWAERVHGVRHASLRYFNAAGADPDGEIGEAHEPETHLIPRALAAAVGAETALHIYGDDWETEDGTCVRDYVHVSDLAEAHVLALNHLLAGGGSVTLNLGTGRGHSVRAIIDIVERVTGRAVLVETMARRTGDSPALVADPAKARALLGWTPRRSGLNEIVTTAWRWHGRAAMPRPVRKLARGS